MHYFYTPDINHDLYRLSEEESKHCVRVLRLGEGDIVVLLDGAGGYYEARIENPNPKGCELRIISSRKDPVRNFSLHIAVAPVKLNERFEWFLEKATEIGIDSITPIVCARSERKELKQERMEKVIISAAKQSIHTWFPKLNEMRSFRELIKGNSSGQRFICYCDEHPLPHLKDIYNKGEDATVLIGPEGDFNEDEVTSAIAAGYIPVSLGTSRLRTETAALVACTTINIINV